MDDWVFCEILAGKLPASVMMRDAGCTAFMDIQPINAGHVLVVPDDHAASLADLPEDAGARLFRTAQQVTAALYSSGLKSEGVNLFLADGEAAGPGGLPRPPARHTPLRRRSFRPHVRPGLREQA